MDTDKIQRQEKHFEKYVEHTHTTNTEPRYKEVKKKFKLHFLKSIWKLKHTSKQLTIQNNKTEIGN